MNYGELTTRIAQVMHRGDLTAQMPNFVADATERINRRLELQLAVPVTDGDTNDVLASYPMLYFYAAMVPACEFVSNLDDADYYDQRFELEADRHYVTAGANTTEPLVITPEGSTDGA
jgi:hypothetical protein